MAEKPGLITSWDPGLLYESDYFREADEPVLSPKLRPEQMDY